MAAENSSNLARIPPPSPFKPSPLPPPPDGHTAIIVIVFISLGSCLFFVAFVAAVVCCFIKKRKKKSSPQEVVEAIRIDGHRKVHENVVEGGHVQQAVMVTIEDDVHIDEIIKKKEYGHGHGLHGKQHEGGSHNNNSTTMEVAASSSTTT
ncbi:unnamed protein product [Citrullus colocynthis]|uniref:Uncharacterized protein n=1 Tax=Citrullus colocynthis TaxID=252529 RepID=A0ABP0XNH3_9ROSI